MQQLYSSPFSSRIVAAISPSLLATLKKSLVLWPLPNRSGVWHHGCVSLRLRDRERFGAMAFFNPSRDGRDGGNHDSGE